MKVGVLALLLLIPFVWGESPPSPIPFHRMERAHILLKEWETGQIHPWPEAERPFNRSVVGHPCSVTPNETLNFMYYRRFLYTLREHPEQDYRILTHVASYLNFYEKKMGKPTLLNHREFCRNPTNHFQLPNGTTGFAWPAIPYPLVCEGGQCVTCDKAVSPENKEACNLLYPSEEPFEPPTEAQLLYEHLKNLSGSFPGYAGLPRIHGEGLPCAATPLKTLAYLTLRRDINASLRDPEDLNSFLSHSEQIHKIQRNLEYYKRMFQNFSGESDLNVKSVYCDYHPSDIDFREGRPDAHGGLVCGGKTCKPCKIRPPDAEGPQEWNFEQGPLFEACNLITSLEVGLPGGKCLPIRPAEPCDSDGNNGGRYHRYKEPCKVPGDWISQWQATADSGSNNCHIVSVSICLVTTAVYFRLTLPN